MSRHFTAFLALACAAALLAPASASAAAKPAAEVDCAQVKCIALTFDDGPGQYAGTLLDTFKKYDAKATFFLEGQYVKSRPAFARRMAKEGHELGNHSYSHRNFLDLEPASIRSEIQKTQDMIKQVTGVTPKLLRPPYGLSDVSTTEAATEFEMPIILWSAGSHDWDSRNEESIKKQVLEVAERDGIILMHDWVKQTVDVMPSIVKTLQSRGYHLVTVSTLVKGQDLQPGDVFPVPDGWT